MKIQIRKNFYQKIRSHCRVFDGESGYFTYFPCFLFRAECGNPFLR